MPVGTNANNAGGVGREDDAAVGAMAASDAQLSFHHLSSSASTGAMTTAATTIMAAPGEKDTFPCRVYRMIEHCHENDPKTASFYDTTPTTTGEGEMAGSSGFIVKDKKKIEEVYLEEFNVCQSKVKGGYPQFDSFHRQLNKYGFTRDNRGKEVRYVHQENLFRRGDIAALQSIKITNVKGTIKPPPPPPPLAPPKLVSPPSSPPVAAAASLANVDTFKKMLQIEVCTMRRSLERFVEDKIVATLAEQLHAMKEAKVEKAGADARATLATEVASIRGLLSSLVQKVDAQHDESLKLLRDIQHSTAATTVKNITVPVTTDTTNDGNGEGVGGSVGTGVARQDSPLSPWNGGNGTACCKRIRGDDDDECASITDFSSTTNPSTDSLSSSSEEEVENGKHDDENHGNMLVHEPGQPSCTKPINHQDEQTTRREGETAESGKTIQGSDYFDNLGHTEGCLDDISLSCLFDDSSIDTQIVLSPQKMDGILLDNQTSESPSTDTPMDEEERSKEKQCSNKKRKTHKRSSGTASLSPSISSSVSTLTASTVTVGSSSIGSLQSDFGHRPSLYSIQPCENDVLCATEGDFSSHPGNVRHMDLVAKSVATYRRASAAIKSDIIRSIVVNIHRHGLFLEQAPGAFKNACGGDGNAMSCWYELSFEASMKITSRAFEKAILGTNFLEGDGEDGNDNNGGGDGPNGPNSSDGDDDENSGGRKRGGNGRGGGPSDGSSLRGGSGGPGTDSGGESDEMRYFTARTKSPAIKTKVTHHPFTSKENGNDDSSRQQRDIELHHLSSEGIKRSASKPVDCHFEPTGCHSEEQSTFFHYPAAEVHLCERLGSTTDRRRLVDRLKSILVVEGWRKEEGRRLVEEHGKEEERRGRVTFSHVTERRYGTILGDNPACSSGPPIALGRQCQATVLTGIDEYENLRRSERRKHAWELILSPQQRTVLLSEKYSKWEIDEAMRGVNKTKMHRQKCVRKMMMHTSIDGIRNVIQATERSLRWMSIVGRNDDKKAADNKGNKGQESSVQEDRRASLPRKMYATGAWGARGIQHRDSLEIMQARMSQDQ